MSNPTGAIHAVPRTLYLKHLSPDQVRAILERDSRLIVPVGKTEEHGSFLPLGCDTIILERLADDLSTEFGVLRAPTVEYGVNASGTTDCPGSATVRRKTLHRFLNDLVGHWELGGVTQFIILTGHAFDPHQEALSTLHTRNATVRTVDVFAVPQPEPGADWTLIPPDDLDAALLRYIKPELATDPAAVPIETGERLYRVIYERIAARIFGRNVDENTATPASFSGAD
jgi:creatinine amidohydrolase/Fe(II)-dependent formamide hydrolase-like protein